MTSLRWETLIFFFSHFFVLSKERQECELCCSLSWLSVLQIQTKLVTKQRNLFTIPHSRSHEPSNTWSSAELDTKQMLCLFLTLASTQHLCRLGVRLHPHPPAVTRYFLKERSLEARAAASEGPKEAGASSRAFVQF